MQMFINYLWNKRNNHFFSTTSQLLSQFVNSHCQDFFRTLVQLLLILNCLSLNYTTPMHMQHGDIHILPHFIISKYIYVTCMRISNNCFALEILDQFELFFQSTSLFIAHFYSTLHHFLFNLFADFLRITFDNLTSSIDIFLILFTAHFLLTNTTAITQMILQTQAIFAHFNATFVHLHSACTYRVELMYKF